MKGIEWDRSDGWDGSNPATLAPVPKGNTSSRVEPVTLMVEIGLLNVCKLPGMSSHAVVNRVRRITGLKRVGHTGTLDPAACGVLPICLGSATRLAEYIDEGYKTYRAEFLFGVTTESFDAEKPVSECVDAGHLDEKTVTAAIPAFTGTFQQFPPALSAVQIGGLRAYDLVRRGEEVNIPARTVTVSEFSPIRFISGAHPRLLADITCSKGTYIRALARDLGELLGVGGILSFLARTRVGTCRLEEAFTLDEIDEARQEDHLDDVVLPPDSTLGYLPAFEISPNDTRYRDGAFARATGEPGIYRVYQHGAFIGLGRLEEGLMRPVVNLR
ncbi:MAG: tRNA pseudouridine(55) synthase TruB [Armatimonadota bacterium]